MFERATCWIDGAIVPVSEAKISVFDHGFLYGDGVFEGIRFYQKTVFRLPLHIQRLQQSAMALQLALPFNEEGLIAAITATLEASPLVDGYLRLIVTRGVGVLGINPTSCNTPSMIIIADQLNLVSEAQREKGVKAIIASTRRPSPDQLDTRIKSLNYLNSIMARMEANYAGVEEAILLNERGHVAEGTADNVFIVSESVLLTPPVTEGALAGITRATVIELAHQLAIPVQEAILTAYDLYTADECFLTGTGAKLIPVAEIDGRKMRYAVGAMYQQLTIAFMALIEKERNDLS